MGMGQGVVTGVGHGGITCVLQTQFSSFYIFCNCNFNLVCLTLYADSDVSGADNSFKGTEGSEIRDFIGVMYELYFSLLLYFCLYRY